MNENNQLLIKSKYLALSVIKIYNFLTLQKKEYILSKQLIRSGTSVGANVREGVNGFSKDDFYYKLNTALKEAAETEYWLELLHESNYLNDNLFNESYNLCKECIKILTATVKHKNK